jgi:hypothetical protein
VKLDPKEKVGTNFEMVESTVRAVLLRKDGAWGSVRKSTSSSLMVTSLWPFESLLPANSSLSRDLSDLTVMRR